MSRRARTEGCPNDRWSVLSSDFLYKTHSISSDYHLCTRKLSFILSGCHFSPRLTKNSWMGTSNSFSTIYFMENKVGIFAAITSNWTSSITSNRVNNICNVIESTDLLVTSYSFYHAIVRASHHYRKRKCHAVCTILPDTYCGCSVCAPTDSTFFLNGTFLSLSADLRYASSSLRLKRFSMTKCKRGERLGDVQIIHTCKLYVRLTFLRVCGHQMCIERTLTILVAVMDFCQTKNICQIFYRKKSIWLIIAKLLYTRRDSLPSMFVTSKAIFSTNKTTFYSFYSCWTEPLWIEISLANVCL